MGANTVLAPVSYMRKTERTQRVFGAVKSFSIAVRGNRTGKGSGGGDCRADTGVLAPVLDGSAAMRLPDRRTSHSMFADRAGISPGRDNCALF